MTLDFQIEQGGRMLGAVKAVSGGLIDRNGNGPGKRVGRIAAMYSYRLRPHVLKTPR